MNKDSAIDYLIVAHTALQSKDRIKCERLIKKAQNLCPDLNPRREDLVGSQCPLFSRFEDLDSILAFVAEYGQESTSSTSNHRKREPEPQETEEKNYTDEDVKDVKDLLAKQNDYYKVLGVEKTATADDIKRAYRKMAMKFHPDRNSVPHSSEAFKLVSAAYVTLSDSQKRKMYDHYGTDDPQHIHQHRSPFGQRMNVNGHTFTFGQDDDDIFFDLFANLFGGGMHPDVLQQRMRMRHQRQRQHQHVHRQQQMETNNGFGFYILQIGVILFIILSSVFNYSFFSSGNTHHETASSSFFSFQKSDHYPMMRYMQVSKSVSIPYFVTPYVNAQMNANHLAKKQVESQVYYNYEPYLQAKCKQEMHEKDQKAQAGSAARSGDERWKNMDAAEKMQLPSCEALRRFKAGNTH